MTYALLWYPLAAALVAAGIGLWAWNDCGSVADPARCREAVVPGSLLLLAVFLIAGLAVLLLVWVTLRLLGPALRRGPTDEEAGWAPHGAGWTDDRAGAGADDAGASEADGTSEARPVAGDPNGTHHVVPSRSRRHDRSGS